MANDNVGSIVSYGVRFRKTSKDPWRRSRTRTNPNGRWGKVGAAFIVRLLTARGYQAHSFPILTYPNAERYSPNFTRAELECKCGCDTPRSIEIELTLLARDLEVMRREYGQPIRVISGYRCRAYNTKIGGATNSQHLYGRAADILSTLAVQDALESAALATPSFKDGGIGKYPAGGLHVDRRGYPARWTMF